MYKQCWLEQYKQRLEKKKTAIQTLATLFGNQPSSRLILTCLHYFNQLQTFVHILACGKETLKHKNLEVIVHVAVDTTHYLEAKQSTTLNEQISWKHHEIDDELIIWVELGTL